MKGMSITLPILLLGAGLCTHYRPEAGRFATSMIHHQSLPKLFAATGLLLLSVSVAAAGGSAASGPAAKIRIPARLDRPADASYALAGPIHERVRGVISNWLLLAPDHNPALLDMFADRDRPPYRDLLPWSGEFAGKYLTASAQIVRLTHNAALRTKIQKFVDRLVTLQDRDGYLGPFPKAYRLAGSAPNVAGGATWDAWGHYHLIVGLLLWHDQTRDANALRCAQRIGDLLCDRFLDGGKRVADIGSPDQNQSVIHGLCLLYEKTGTKRYLDLAEQIVAEFEIPGAGDYLRTALAGKEFYATPRPRWESLHAILGLGALYRITGKDEYRRVFEHIWWSIVKLDRHNNGGFSSGEQAVGNPYDGGAIETCCTIAWLATSVEMLRTTGNSIVADEMELSTLNSVVGLHAPDGEWSTYNTPMDGRRIPSTQDISFQIRPGAEQLNCCSVNAARGFGLISDWGLMTETGPAKTPATLVLNWYGPSALSAKIAGIRVTLRQDTVYPRDGRIVLQVDPERAAKFAFKLRIPYWSATTTVAVSGVAAPARAGTYCVLERRWKPGDRVVIDLDMRLRVWAGERECAGKVSLYRGPLLLAHEQPHAAARLRPGAWQNFGKLFASREKGAAFEYDFDGEGIQWFGNLFDDAGKSRVLIDGSEIAVVDQYGPVREEPFTWEHRGLAPGKHTIRIEVSGEKTPESRDTWSNVVGFGPPGAARPESLESFAPLDLTALTARRISSADETAGALVVVDVTDGVGQTVRLRDFGTAGERGVPYSSWLPARNARPTPFSKENPLRSAAAGQ